MSSKLEKIYAVMPVSVQNLMVSVKGWTLKRKRYAKEYHQYLDSLMRSQWFSAEQFRDLQTAELRKLLREAIQNVPYYRDSLSKFSDRFDTIEVEGLRDIPFLEKSTLRTNIEQCINPNRLKYGYSTFHTSGTTGSPLLLKCDLISLQHQIAFRERQYRWAGTTGREKSARFSGKRILGKHNRTPYWRYNAADNQYLFSVYHLKDETMPDYYEALKYYDFVFLDGYPTAIFTIAQWINKKNKSSEWKPQVIFTTAETLTDFHREEIEKAFGCKVFNNYSSGEGAPFITQCTSGRMHLNPESGIIEFLRPDGSPVEAEEDAEMVVTSFFQRTMPLIRYRIGDIGTLAEDQACPCGRHMPIVKCVRGREFDTLYSTERGTIGSTAASTIHNAIPRRVEESQIEQVEIDSFVFRYVPNNEPLNEKEQSIIIEEFHKCLGNSIDIKIEIVKKISKGPNGKSRLVIGLEKR